MMQSSASGHTGVLNAIASKNGNQMLSAPLWHDGQPDADEIKIFSEIGVWLKVNGEAIYATRPWKIYGAGPSTVASGEKGQLDGQSAVQKTPFTPDDIHFMQSKNGRTLYAIAMEIPRDSRLAVKLKKFRWWGASAQSIGNKQNTVSSGNCQRKRHVIILWN